MSININNKKVETQVLLTAQQVFSQPNQVFIVSVGHVEFACGEFWVVRHVNSLISEQSTDLIYAVNAANNKHLKVSGVISNYEVRRFFCILCGTAPAQPSRRGSCLVRCDGWWTVWRWHHLRSGSLWESRPEIRPQLEQWEEVKTSESSQIGTHSYLKKSEVIQIPT